jgi:D-xylose transport system substrate-binding protein
MCLRKFFTLFMFIILSICIILLFGCATNKNKPPKNGGKITIGFSMDTLQQERWYKDRDDFIADANNAGAKVIVNVAYNSDSAQYLQVKAMLDEGIDVLVIIPHDAVVEEKSVALAKKYGVKVISYDRLVEKAGVDLYVSFDNVKVGELLARTMLQAVPNGNYAIINGPTSDYNTIMIDEGIKSVLNPLIQKGTIKIVKESYTADWMSDEASDCIQKLLQDNVNINAVIAENDSLAGGVINTLSENQLTPKVPVDGMDADLAACKRVVEGQQLMTVYKPINLLAKAAVKYAIMLAKGENLNVNGRIYDGKYNVPYYMIEPIAVNKDNMMSTIIKDGFQKMSDVYMNIPQTDWPTN